MSRTPHGFYKSKAWRSFRAAYLLAHPVCAVPGCGRLALHVDHVVAVEAGGALLDPRNATGYCQPHHSVKTATSDGGWGNPKGKVRPVRMKGVDALGVPLDPGHPWARR